MCEQANCRSRIEAQDAGGIHGWFPSRCRRYSDEMRAITPDDARRFHDRSGARQDTRGFYENPVLDDLLKCAGFEHSRSVEECRPIRGL